MTSAAIEVKDWFLRKNFTQNERFAISTIKSWVPKSCLVTDEDREARVKAADEAAARYDALLDECKAAGIKGVRRGWRIETMRQRLAEARGGKVNE